MPHSPLLRILKVCLLHLKRGERAITLNVARARNYLQRDERSWGDFLKSHIFALVAAAFHKRSLLSSSTHSKENVEFLLSKLMLLFPSQFSVQSILTKIRKF